MGKIHSFFSLPSKTPFFIDNPKTSVTAQNEDAAAEQTTFIKENKYAENAAKEHEKYEGADKSEFDFDQEEADEVPQPAKTTVITSEDNDEMLDFDIMETDEDEDDDELTSKTMKNLGKNLNILFQICTS